MRLSDNEVIPICWSTNTTLSEPVCSAIQRFPHGAMSQHFPRGGEAGNWSLQMNRERFVGMMKRC